MALSAGLPVVIDCKKLECAIAKEKTFHSLAVKPLPVFWLEQYCSETAFAIVGMLTKASMQRMPNAEFGTLNMVTCGIGAENVIGRSRGTTRNRLRRLSDALLRRVWKSSKHTVRVVVVELLVRREWFFAALKGNPK